MKSSVCIATYNGGTYIKQQIQSILDQLEDGDEIIISDNGSTDNTLETINELRDSRIRIFKFHCSDKLHPHERVTKNFEYALKQASGELIFLADQDDWWEPDKLMVTKSNIAHCDLVISDAYLVVNNIKNLENSFFNGDNPITGLIRKLFRLKYHGCTMAFRRSLLQAALPFPDSLILHDGWLGLIAELTGKAIFIDKKLVNYRIHDNNTSASNNSIRHKISYRLQFFKELFIRYKIFNPGANVLSFIAKLHKNPSTELLK